MAALNDEKNYMGAIKTISTGFLIALHWNETLISDQLAGILLQFWHCGKISDFGVVAQV